jgi:hypothetical protein
MTRAELLKAAKLVAGGWLIYHTDEDRNPLGPACDPMNPDPDFSCNTCHAAWAITQEKE